MSNEILTSTQIKAEKKKIKDLFAEDQWYTIPNYQRPYTWGEDKIHLLLDDIYHAANTQPNLEYFLGSLVLNVEEKDHQGTRYLDYSVLDGQQRLTTLFLW
jgi:uncharacterized protein with ParB-like and HNH nuclease domain